MLSKKLMNVIAIGLVIASVSFASCSKDLNKSEKPLQASQNNGALKAMMDENGTNPDEASVAKMQSGSVNKVTGSYLYTEDNNAGTNSIITYKINDDGTLQPKGTTASGGVGTGAGLGSQGALVLSQDHLWLFAVNAGSNSVSSYKVKNDGSLKLMSTAGTKGTTPVSIAVYGNKVYVLNRGTDNIHGFWLGQDGELTDITGSDEPLSSTAVDAPQISFTPYGDWIVVTEKATNIVGTFKVNSNGSVAAGIFTPSVGATPFGFAFSRNTYMIVSNAAGGGAGLGSATSYTINGSGTPADVNGAIANSQSAPCWFAVAKYGRFAYTTNTASNNVSSYYIANNGALYLVQSNAAATEAGPVDIVVAANNYFVYELNGGGKSIGCYHRMFLGSLALIGNETGLPASSTGLATY